MRNKTRSKPTGKPRTASVGTARGNGREVFDSITLELAWTRLISTTDEAAETLKRTSFSTLVNESNDYAVVITDSKGDLIVQNTDSIPAFIGTLPVTVKHFVHEFDEELQEGDVLATNYPWIASGHLNDITLVKPLFRDGRVFAYAGSCAHAPDIGGRARSQESREVFEEGFMIPPMKVFRAGEPDQTFFKLFLFASRMPDETEGDIWAALNALKRVEQRVGEILDDYRLKDLDRVSREINKRGETAMRKAIRALPDGVYRSGFETDGFETPLHFETRITIRGGRMRLDYENTSAAVPRAINCPMTYTFAMTAYALKCLLLPDLPNCEGPLRCIEVHAPEGCILNPSYPSAVGCRTAVGQYVPPLIYAALAKIVPDRVMAAPGSPLWSCVQTGRRPNGKAYTNVLFFNGGMGATAAKDGEPCYSWPSNVSNVPVEMTEAMSPLFVHHKTLVPDSGGKGKHRGGLGIETLFEVESETPVTLGFIAERIAYPAPGLLGGGDGGKGLVQIDGKNVDHRNDHFLGKGGTVLMRTPGGGGLGPPSRRSRKLIERDKELGYITRW